MDIRPFRIAITDVQIDDLRSRLRAARWPTPVIDAGWKDGTDLKVMKRLVEEWRDRFDWRAQEARLNRLPHVMATVEDTQIHVVHQQGRGPAPLPLIITHGWPGSFVEMERIIPLLADPGAHGCDPADAFHVVVPSLPGYGFSPAPAAAGVGSRRIAELWRGLMEGLGYPRFAAQGGDIGAGVSMWLARLFPNAVVGAHVNFIPGSYKPPLGAALPPVTTEEQAYLDGVAAWTTTEGGYAHLHGTKPQTLAYALTDSPIGLAAWIVEKVRAWSDCDGDVERAFGFDALLTDISLYWFGDTLNASMRLYKENRLASLTFEAGERVRPPLAWRCSPRTAAPATLVGRTGVPRAAMDGHAVLGPFRRVGTARPAGRGHPCFSSDRCGRPRRPSFHRCCDGPRPSIGASKMAAGARGLNSPGRSPPRFQIGLMAANASS